MASTPLSPSEDINKRKMSSEDRMMAAASEAFKISATPLERLKNHLLSKGYRGILDFARLFEETDTDNDWVLSENELRKRVAKSDFKISDKELKELYKQLEIDGEEGISFEEILAALRPDLSKARLNVVDAAYKKLDVTGDGVVTLEDIKLAYNAKDHPKVLMGEMTEDQVLMKFLNRFEGLGPSDGKLTRNEFINYYACLSTIHDEDESFVTMVKNCWDLE